MNATRRPSSRTASVGLGPTRREGDGERRLDLLCTPPHKSRQPENWRCGTCGGRRAASIHTGRTDHILRNLRAHEDEPQSRVRWQAEASNLHRSCHWLVAHGKGGLLSSHFELSRTGLQDPLLPARLRYPLTRTPLGLPSGAAPVAVKKNDGVDYRIRGHDWVGRDRCGGRPRSQRSFRSWRGDPCDDAVATSSPHAEGGSSRASSANQRTDR